MGIYIDSLDGNRYDLDDYGLRSLKFEIDSLSPRSVTDTIDGRDGFIDIDTTYEGRSMRASFLLFSQDFTDFLLLQDKVFKLFDGKTYFYLTDSRYPSKRWKVKTTSKFTMEKVNPSVGKFDIEFISQSSYAESTVSTLDGSLDGYFQVSTPEPVKYVFDDTNFSVWNDGDITIDPCERDVIITITGVTENLTITNNTTGDVWQYTGTTASGDVIELNGIRSLKNDVSIFGQTNKKLITLAPGYNDFSITGATGTFQISFDIRFYYI